MALPAPPPPPSRRLLPPPVASRGAGGGGVVLQRLSGQLGAPGPELLLITATGQSRWDPAAGPRVETEGVKPWNQVRRPSRAGV